MDRIEEVKKTRNWSNCQRFDECTDPKRTIVTYCDVSCQLFEPKTLGQILKEALK